MSKKIKPKINKTQKKDIEKQIMAKISSGEIKMKPKWYFILGSVLMIIGLTALSISSIFLTNITLFLVKKHGPMGQWKAQYLISNLPLWIPLLAVFGIVVGLWFLKKYDFSYKKNFGFIIVGFILTIIIAAFAIDYLGLNNIWSKKGPRPMRRFYQRLENQSLDYPSRQLRKGRNNNF